MIRRRQVRGYLGMVANRLGFWHCEGHFRSLKLLERCYYYYRQPAVVTYSMGEIQDLPEDQCGRGRPSERQKIVTLSSIVEFQQRHGRE